MSKILGNDVASFQGDINFDVYKNNAQFILCKATEGVGFTDPKFKRNQSEARRVGIALGYYHFARPDLGNTPEKEAEYFLQIIGSLQDGEMLVLDYEPNTQNQSHVDWCKKWLDFVKDKTGVKSLIYLNQSQVQKFNWQTVIDSEYGLWIAAYTYDPNKNDFIKGQWPFAAMQQWTNKQLVAGLPSRADGDVFFGDLDTFKKYGYKSPVVVPPQPTITDQTKLPQFGNKEVQQVLAEYNAKNSLIDSQEKQIADLSKKINDIKNIVNS